MEITPEIVSFLKEVSLGAASGRLQEKAQALLASIEAAQQQRAGDVCEVNPNCSLFKKGSRCDICYSHESRT